MIRGNFDRYCGRDFRKNFGNFDFSRYIAYHNVINRSFAISYESDINYDQQSVREFYAICIERITNSRLRGGGRSQRPPTIYE
ncbi:hypothetical protein SBC1_14620 [Caballeronia sp. SBC1]|nr:hypothetical protein SBC1_14620 [Caballeronia sp. SBC1]